jgi:hypothetical protein
VNQRRIEQFVELGKIRNGFDEGCRNRAALIYARFLATSGLSVAVVRDEIERFGKTCKPPLLPYEVSGAVRSGTEKRFASIRNDTIREWLQITWEEHLALKAKFGRSAWKPYAPGPLNRAQSRRKQILLFVDKYGVVPNRKMAALLKKKGHQVSPT